MLGFIYFNLLSILVTVIFSSKSCEVLYTYFYVMYIIALYASDIILTCAVPSLSVCVYNTQQLVVSNTLQLLSFPLLPQKSSFFTSFFTQNLTLHPSCNLKHHFHPTSSRISLANQAESVFFAWAASLSGAYSGSHCFSCDEKQHTTTCGAGGERFAHA